MTDIASPRFGRHAADGTFETDGVSAPEPSWTPTDIDEERRYRELLTDEIRPLVEACRRLRDRGLLD